MMSSFIYGKAISKKCTVPTDTVFLTSRGKNLDTFAKVCVYRETATAIE